jgi:hypothetical protein
VAAVLAVVLLWFVSGVVPVWQYVDARVVPGGAEVSAATVTGIGTTMRRAGDDNGLRGRVARLELADGTTGDLLLAWRWDYPEVGDTLRVYRDEQPGEVGEDGGAGELRSPTQASLVQLLFGVLMLVLWPVASLGYLRHRRRRTHRSRPGAVAPSRS